MRKTAPHVLAAMGRSVQARQVNGAGRSQAAHVQAAVAAPRGARTPAATPVVQPKRVAPTVPKIQGFSVRGVIQRANNDDNTLAIRQHNITVIGSYSPDIWENVTDAFFRAGYNVDTVVPAALQALIGTKWAKKKIAHKKGTTTSKKRGGTDPNIQACAEYLIQWAQNNPA